MTLAPMRLFLILFVSLLCLGAGHGDAWSDEKTPSVKPSDTMIISMAQQFVMEHFKRQPEDYFDIAFDIANIHPQPDPGYFAVVGGFMANSGGKNYKPHAFGIAIRLICPDHEKLKCWQMEKLVIDQKIILNN
jgi:hypothetical protein